MTLTIITTPQTSLHRSQTIPVTMGASAWPTAGYWCLC